MGTADIGTGLINAFGKRLEHCHFCRPWRDLLLPSGPTPDLRPGLNYSAAPRLDSWKVLARRLLGMKFSRILFTSRRTFPSVREHCPTYLRERACAFFKMAICPA